MSSMPVDMPGSTLEPSAGFDQLRADLKAMEAMLLDTDPRTLA
jgi:hypothetical protein